MNTRPLEKCLHSVPMNHHSALGPVLQYQNHLPRLLASLFFYLLYYLHLGFSKIVFATLWLYILYLG